MKLKSFNWGGLAGVIATAAVGIIGMLVEAKTSEATQTQFGQELTDKILGEIDKKYTLIPKEGGDFNEV